jgi:tRNA (cytidine/uridine-2'-O-)-methyltransferase
MFHIVLFEPQIAPNTGNIIRLCANTGCQLHLIEPMGFDLEEKKLRRAGLDYQDMARVTVYSNYQQFLEKFPQKRIFAFTTKGNRFYDQPSYQEGDVLLFGSETSGISDEVRNSLNEEHRLRIPMLPNNRSMNLSNAVAIVTFEAWRQQGFNGGK